MHRKQKPCPSGKVRHPSRWRANRVVKLLIVTGKAHEHPKGAEGLAAYRCRLCGSWHVGHDKYRKWA